MKVIAISILIYKTLSKEEEALAEMDIHIDVKEGVTDLYVKYDAIDGYWIDKENQEVHVFIKGTEFISNDIKIADRLKCILYDL